jgi:hypothetical protein
MSLGDIYSQRVVGKKITIPIGLGSAAGAPVFEKDSKTSSMEKSVTNKLKEITGEHTPKPPQKPLTNNLPVANEDPREALKKALEELKSMNAI